MKKSIVKNILAIAGIVALCVICCAFTFKATNEFSFNRELNEDNLLAEACIDVESKSYASGLTVTNKDGTIKLSGTVDDGGTILELGKVTLAEGEYTFTCFDDDAKLNGVNAFATYTIDGTKYRVYADIENIADDVVVEGETIITSNTFELASEAELTVYISIPEGVTNRTVKPVIVAGKTAGEFYAPIFEK